MSATPNTFGNHVEGAKHAKTALVLGIIGIFIFGIVLGPIAIVQANKAEAFGTPATGGKVLGWIVTILSAIGVVFWIVTIAAGAGSH